MVTITVSNDNFKDLMAAHPYEKVCIKHKGMSGEVWLEKKFNKMPEPPVKSPISLPNSQFGIVVLTCENADEFTEKVHYVMKRGYKMSSSSCENGCWRAILVLEVSNEN